MKDSLGNEYDREFFMGDSFNRDAMYCSTNSIALDKNKWCTSAADVRLSKDITASSVQVDSLEVTDKLFYKGVSFDDLLEGIQKNGGYSSLRDKLATLSLPGTKDLD